ncbi:hypothetical protein [Bacteroides sp. 519]|uniref:hypothetical protein n=1 Tax=Bacteroides sp. 519 TaxID=2302937 RepID=UPI0013D01973|nr:hypothetical protein [Bacteroides sp. 519]NDV59714.1 hypothetical protein [Bacteroides sp. 519]
MRISSKDTRRAYISIESQQQNTITTRYGLHRTCYATPNGVVMIEDSYCSIDMNALWAFSANSY